MTTELNDWRSLNVEWHVWENQPKETDKILIINESGDVATIFYDPESGQFFCCGPALKGYPTHWANIPSDYLNQN